ncbi:M23 family metallopeptidase [Saprospiraceae bacterium]|nr:M23 family metallopeptidase [Saprospiraceae bacterium]
MKQLLSWCIFATLFVHISCESDKPPERPIVFEQNFPIAYDASIPEGKLPFPHHNPEISEEAYQQLIEDLFVINNYGQYQGGETDQSCYFHDALDIVIPNGTPIFALENGTVRSITGLAPYYKTMAIEDEDEENMGWSYTHIYDFAVLPGEFVEKGQFIGTVRFQGLEHIHLSRIRLKEEGDWKDITDHVKVYPDSYFILRDELPPIIKTPFSYFNNNENVVIDNSELIDSISKKVDIVVQMRDEGQYAGALIGASYWGDRLAVRNIEYDIIKEGVVISSHKSYDFRNIEIAASNEQWRQALTMYKHRNVLDQDPENYNVFHSSYIITNCPEDHHGTIDQSFSDLAWNTTLLDNSGNRKCPDGTYEIRLSATDTNGNTTTVSDFVYVKND